MAPKPKPIAQTTAHQHGHGKGQHVWPRPSAAASGHLNATNHTILAPRRAHAVPPMTTSRSCQRRHPLVSLCKSLATQLLGSWLNTSPPFMTATVAAIAAQPTTSRSSGVRSRQARRNHPDQRLLRQDRQTLAPKTDRPDAAHRRPAR